MGNGFGASFWGFFVLAAAWCAVYFAWAVAANRRDEERDRRRATLEGIGRAPADDRGRVGTGGGEDPGREDAGGGGGKDRGQRDGTGSDGPPGERK